jgi:16S rRNA G966 N2-methylase RsmD
LCRIPEEQHEIYCTTAEDYLHHSKSYQWDIVFFDPPYKEDYLRTLDLLGNHKGLLIVEHHHKNVLPETIGTLVKTRTLKQGDSSLSFYEGLEYGSYVSSRH